MNYPVLVVGAQLRLRPGSKMLFQPPETVYDGFFGTRDRVPLFDKYRGQICEYVGPKLEYVGLDDPRDREPGGYCVPDDVVVKFSDGSQHTLDIRTLLALEGDIIVEDVSFRAPLSSQYVRELPEPIIFYPGDVVAHTSDLLKTERVISECRVNKDTGNIHYVVLETSDEQKARRTELQKHTASLDPANAHIQEELSEAYLSNELSQAQDLELVKRGNSYYLYNDPSKLSFETEDEELEFWVRRSHAVLNDFKDHRDYVAGFLPWTLERALEQVSQGHADLFVPAHKSMRPFQGYRFSKLNLRFSYARDRVHSFTLAYWSNPARKTD